MDKFDIDVDTGESYIYMYQDHECYIFEQK